MNDGTLENVAGIVSAHFSKHGIEIVVVGGSALTLHVPDVYVSHDIDIAIGSSTASRRDIAQILRQIGFKERGRDFVHPDYDFTVDFVAHTPMIEQRQIKDFAEIQTVHGVVKTLFFEDAIADRLAAFVHWDDRQSLSLALRAIGKLRGSVDRYRLSVALASFDAPDKRTANIVAFMRREIERALGCTLPPPPPSPQSATQ